MIRNELVKYYLKQAIIVAIISAIGGALFTYIISGIDSRTIFWGGLTGFLIGSSIFILERSLLNNSTSRLKFLPLLFIKVLTYSLIFIIVLTLNTLSSDRSKGMSFFDIISEPNFFKSFQFSIGLTFIFIFFLMINSLLGKGILIKFILGRYSSPKEENKIFMFVDVKSSTAIAEKLGHKKFMSFINDFFYDLSTPVLLTKGEIYKYVGDEAIISWEYVNGKKNCNCLNCFFQIEQSVQRRKNYYLEKYGVITGEIGNLKKEISYMGDVLNTTARIENQCGELNESFLVSEDLFKSLSIPETYIINEYKDQELRGKENKINLFAISKKAYVHDSHLIN